MRLIGKIKKALYNRCRSGRETRWSTGILDFVGANDGDGSGVGKGERLVVVPLGRVNAGTRIGTARVWPVSINGQRIVRGEVWVRFGYGAAERSALRLLCPWTLVRGRELAIPIDHIVDWDAVLVLLISGGRGSNCKIVAVVEGERG